MLKKVCYHNDGTINEIYVVNNKQFHNTKGPSNIVYFIDNNFVKTLCYDRYDKLHRLDGPAIIHYDCINNISIIKNYSYFIRGTSVLQISGSKCKQDPKYIKKINLL